MSTPSMVGTRTEARSEGAGLELELELPADDLDVVAGGLPESGPQGVKCEESYCPKGYCQSGYSSD